VQRHDRHHRASPRGCTLQSLGKMSQESDQESGANLGKPPRGNTPSSSLRPWLPWFLALLTGVMVGGSFPPWEHRWLTWMPWLALAPLCWALWLLPRPDSSRIWARHCFLLGWLSGTVSFLISLQWITTVTAPGWVALSLIVGLYHGLWALFAGLVLRPLGETKNPASAWLGSLRNLIVALLAAAAWVATALFQII